MNFLNIANANRTVQPRRTATGCLLCALALSALVLCATGCQRNIVKASPPSVSTPPPTESTPPVAAPTEPQTTTAPPPTAAPEPPPSSAPQPAPAHHKPAAPAATEPQSPSESSRPAAPVISPELTPQAQATDEHPWLAGGEAAEGELGLEGCAGEENDVAGEDLEHVALLP